MNLTEKQIEDHKAWLQDQKPAHQAYVGALIADKLTAAESALAEAEPVAWRWCGRVSKAQPWNAWDAGPEHPPYPVSENYQIEPLYAAPLPQSAPVSREAVIEEYAKVCDGMADEQCYNIDEQTVAKCCANSIRALAAHPAEPAGKGE